MRHYCRTLRCEAGLLTRADGSAKWTQGSTEVLVGVYGPRQGAAFLEDAERATIAVAFEPKSGFSGQLAFCMEHLLLICVHTVKASLASSTLPLAPADTSDIFSIYLVSQQHIEWCQRH